MSGEEPGKQEECQGNYLTHVCLQKQSENTSIASDFSVIWVLFLNQGQFNVLYKYKSKRNKVLYSHTNHMFNLAMNFKVLCGHVHQWTS